MPLTITGIPRAGCGFTGLHSFFLCDQLTLSSGLDGSVLRSFTGFPAGGGAFSPAEVERREVCVVCNACGRETKNAHLFCGTCGTSLPHAPLAIPGAESTLTFTRSLRICPAQSEPHRTYKDELSISSERTGVLVETSNSPDFDAAGFSHVTFERETLLDSSTTPKVPPNLRIMGAPQPHPELADGLADREMVPEISLDEYVGQFHYEPPNEPEELTMRGDAATGKSESPSQRPEAGALPIKPMASLQVPPPRIDVQRSIPLESAVPAKATSRKMFDLPHSMPAPSSFSRLRPMPGALSDRVGDRAVGTWRLWLLAVTIGVLGVLGILQWHARKGQTSQGPPEVLKQQSQAILRGREAAAVKGVLSSANKVQQPAAETSGVGKQSPDKGNTSSLRRPMLATGTKAEGASRRASSAPNGDRKSSTKDARRSELKLVKYTDSSDGTARAAWLLKATARGNPDAPVELANLYLMGDGVPRSCEKAMLLLKTAAAETNVRARNRLASMYAVGTCVQRDRVQAYRWLRSALAADPTNYWAQQNRDLIWRQMTPEERIQEQNDR